MFFNVYSKFLQLTLTKKQSFKLVVIKKKKNFNRLVVLHSLYSELNSECKILSQSQSQSREYYGPEV